MTPRRRCRPTSEFVSGGGRLRSPLVDHPVVARTRCSDRCSPQPRTTACHAPRCRPSTQLLGDMAANETFVRPIHERCSPPTREAARPGHGRRTPRSRWRWREAGVSTGAPPADHRRPDADVRPPADVGLRRRPDLRRQRQLRPRRPRPRPSRAGPAVLDVVRTYNSLAAATPTPIGAFGPGWTSVLDLRLRAGRRRRRVGPPRRRRRSCRS